MGDEKYKIGIRKDVYDFIHRIWNRTKKKEERIKKLLQYWDDNNDDFRKELMSNLSPDDAVYIINYVLNNK